MLNGGLGIYSKGVNEDVPSEVTINGGTFFDIDVSYSKLVIENVNIEGEYHGITLNSGSDVVINGGTVNVGPEGNAFEVGSNNSENIKVVVNGGTFRGGENGLYAILESYDQLSLRGGAFNGSLAAVIVKSLDATSGDALNTTLTDLLGEGYTYSPNMTFTTEKNSVLWMAKTNQKDLFVVPNTNNNQNNSAVTLVSSTTNNPNTGDNIMFFITMFGLSVLGLTSVSLYKIYN